MLCWVPKDKQGKGAYPTDSQEPEGVKGIANNRLGIYIQVSKRKTTQDMQETRTCAQETEP